MWIPLGTESFKAKLCLNVETSRSDSAAPALSKNSPIPKYDCAQIPDSTPLTSQTHLLQGELPALVYKACLYA